MRSLGRSKPTRFRSAATSTSQRRSIQHRIAWAFLRFAFSFLAMQMQMIHPMQQMQPRLVLRQAVPRQPVVLSHAQAAQPWLGQVHQLPAQVKPGRMVPVAMPIVKAVVKPVAKPSPWIYAAPLQSTRGHLANPKVGLPCPKPQVVSTHVKPPERKELPLIGGQVPKDQGVEGMHPIDFKNFWEQSLFKFC